MHYNYITMLTLYNRPDKSLNLYSPIFHFITLFFSLLGVPTSLFLVTLLSRNSLMGVPREEVDALSPDCIEHSSKRHEEKSLNQGD